MTTIRYTDEAIRKLADSLPRGSRVIIQERTVSDKRPSGYSLQHIYDVLKGRKYTQEILDAAFAYAIELKAKIEENQAAL